MKSSHNSKIMSKTPIMGSVAIPQDATSESVTVDKAVSHAKFSYYLQSQNHVQQITINKFPYLIGSAGDVDLCIKKPGVEEKHSVIEFNSKTITIETLSKNSEVKVNNHPVKRVILQDGDIINISGQIYKFAVKNKQSDLRTDHSENRSDNAQIPQKKSVLDLSPVTQTKLFPIENDSLRDKKNAISSIKIALIICSLILLLVGLYAIYQKISLADSVFIIEKSITDTVEKDQGLTQQNRLLDETKFDQKIINNSLNDKIKPINNSVQLLISSKNEKNNKSNILPNKKHLVSSTKEKILYEHTKSRNDIALAIKLFHQGAYQESISLLKKIKTSNRYALQYRDEADKITILFTELHELYQKGSIGSNNSRQAFQYWVKLLDKVSKHFPGQGNQYALNVKKTVAMEYERRGNAAYANEEWSKAYSNWEKSNKLISRPAITEALKLMDADIKRIYLIAYRFETADLKKANVYWQQVIDKSPRNHPYHIKANAKLQWYSDRR